MLDRKALSSLKNITVFRVYSFRNFMVHGPACLFKKGEEWEEWSATCIAVEKNRKGMQYYIDTTALELIYQA